MKLKNDTWRQELEDSSKLFHSKMNMERKILQMDQTSDSRKVMEICY